MYESFKPNLYCTCMMDIFYEIFCVASDLFFDYHSLVQAKVRAQKIDENLVKFHARSLKEYVACREFRERDERR